jgi:hypothetical protein
MDTERVIYLRNWLRLICVAVLVMAVGGCDTRTAAPGAAAQNEHRLDWGVFVPDDRDGSSNLFTIKDMAGSLPQYVLRFAAIDEKIQIPQLTEINTMGAVPILTLEPWQPDGGTIQPDYALARIAAGSVDPQLDAWARNLAEWGQPVVLRFGHEMNTDRYPWSVGVNGNSAADYLAAWRHVRDRFSAARADNVSFMWCPNAPYEGAANMAESFPGSDSVDLLGLDGYNWGDGDGHTWKTPEEIFGEGIKQLRALDPVHPIVIAETASVEGPASGTDKAAWIKALVDFLMRQDRVSGFVWFQMNKERDWRFNSSAQSQAAFKAALTSRPSPP